jgi:hypothetical protein
MWNKPFNYEWLVQLQNLSHKFILHCHFEKYIMKVFYCIVHIQKHGPYGMNQLKKLNLNFKNFF